MNFNLKEMNLSGCFDFTNRLLLLGSFIICSSYCFGQVDYVLKTRLNKYNPELYNERICHKDLVVNQGEQFLQFDNSKWKAISTFTTDNKGDRIVNLMLVCIEGKLENASASMVLDFPKWSKDNYVLMPGAVYNGNRYPAIIDNYPPFYSKRRDMKIDAPITLSNQPRLNHTEGLSRIQLRSGSMTIPSVGFRDSNLNKGFWLFFDQGNNLGDYGVTLTETKGFKTSEIVLTSPVVRERTQYYIANNDVPSKDKPKSFVKGDTVHFKCKIVEFEAPKTQNLYDKWVTYREEYHPKSPIAPILPLSHAFKVIESKFNRQNWKPGGYYGVGTFDHTHQDWQTGWVGGMMYTLPLLEEGGNLSKKRVIHTFDWFFENGLSPSGYYYDRIYKNKPGGLELPNSEIGDSLVLTRKNADAIYYIFKQFKVMDQHGISIKPQWEQGNLAALNAQLGTWKKYGQLGQYVNQITGRLVVGNTTSSGIFPAALCAAYEYTGNQEYLKYAIEIADYYYDNFITKGLICGGPGDAMQSFDAESSYGLLVSLVDIYESTKDLLWLNRAEEMGNQFLSWVVGYDFSFPEGSLYAELDIRTTGGVYANTQNQHAGSAICTHSGEALLKLYRFTKNEMYLNVLKDIVYNMPQYLSTKERPIECLEEGWVSERINMTDWLEGIGETMCGSTWAETSMLLTYLEIPGAYIDIEKNTITTLDNLIFKLVDRTRSKLVVSIENPTNYEAETKVFFDEGAEDLNTNGWRHFKVYKISPGEKRTISYKIKNK